MTAKDYENLPEGTLAELIDGEILISPSPKLRHQQVVTNLVVALREFVQRRSLGTVLVAPMDVHLPGGEIVQPDVVFVSKANAAILQDWIRGAPDLTIEVPSPDRVERDRIVKRALYARSGVREYWLVDDASRSVEVLALEHGQYRPCGSFLGDESVTSGLLPELAVPLADVFA